MSDVANFIKRATMHQDSLTQQTFNAEKKRALMSGIFETAGTTFLLLIAVKFYNSSSLLKGILVSANSFGLVLSPLLLSFCIKKNLRIGKLLSFLYLLSSIFFLLPSIYSSEYTFLILTVLGSILISANVPLLTVIYENNYPKETRGKLFAKCFSYRIAAAIIFSFIAGVFLKNNMEDFWLILLIFGLSLLASSFYINSFPTPFASALSSSSGTRESFKQAFSDKVFRNTLISWMFLGFGNLMMFPLRIEYLANPTYGLNYSPEKVAIICGVVPNIIRLFLNPLWGNLFDKLNFFILRIILNLGFALGTLIFFFGDSLIGILIGSIAYGISSAGADVAWNLWVTKFAAKDKIAGYMAVHTFLTGIRGVLAPIAAFQLLKIITINQLSLFSLALIIIASIILLFELKPGKKIEVADQVNF